MYKGEYLTYYSVNDKVVNAVSIHDMKAVSVKNKTVSQQAKSDGEVNAAVAFECLEVKDELSHEQQKRAYLAQEVALSLSYNGISHAVMMISPYDLDDFILGFSISEGIIRHAIELKDITYQQTPLGLDANALINARCFHALKEKRRQLSGRTGCGICGREALDNLWLDCAPLSASVLPSMDALLHLNEKISQWQQQGNISGGLHAALFLCLTGEIIACREDIGRHNALDKLLGWLGFNDKDVTQGFIVMTSRCSYELVQKSVQHGIHTLVTLSAPSTMAVVWAQKYNLNLIHVLKTLPPRIYHRSV